MTLARFCVKSHKTDFLRCSKGTLGFVPISQVSFHEEVPSVKNQCISITFL